MKELNVGLIGHQFMGKAHSNAYHNVAKFFTLKAKPVMKVVCGIGPDVPVFAERWGWKENTQNYKEVVKRDDIHMVDICTPNKLHAEMAIAAAENKKAVLCEKPMAMDAAEAKQMVAAAKKNKVPTLVSFCYRRAPAVTFMKQMIAAGKLGRVYHVRAQYLQDWIMDPKFPRVWRLVKAITGSGAHGDLNAHIVDMARYLVGDIDEVVGMTETFIKQRPLEAPGAGAGLRDKKAGSKTGAVDVDDACAFLARFANGAMGTFEASRFSGGHKNGIFIEVNGSKGSFKFNFEDMNELWYLDLEEDNREQGFKRILVTEPNHPYVGVWWPAGHIIGYEHNFVNMLADFINDGIVGRKPVMPDFADALKTQLVLDAVLKSAEERCWVKVGK
ncbi:Gfo/Idh/MocA family oxidoreductase [bacterium]|nr:Gfo/Idh/MocA family oxidoreductase [bacterium]